MSEGKERKKVMRKMYLYSISYFHSYGTGCAQIARKKKINSFEEYENVRKFIEERNNLKKVGIITYQLICKCKGEDIEEMRKLPPPNSK